MTRDRSKDPPKTAADLMAELQKDPDYLARMRFKERQSRENAEAYARAAQPVLEDLGKAGFHVGSIGELRQGGQEYGGAVPILLRWLPGVDYPPLKEDIVRTLSVPWAGPSAAPALIAEFERSRTDDPAGTGLRWAIANALSVVAGDSVFEEVVRLVRDAASGKARGMLAMALGNMKDPRAVTELIDLLGEEAVAGHAAAALGKLKAGAARPHLEALKKHPRAWIRQEARKALSKIGKGAV